ncbi:hypothetical protein DSCO28_17610 [Desulfosarcina ovata subsp. sediminis]|uniref:Uncharacterized protein n=1 Tax=Desulfosarcina ovata subsp. sediminis TaxID=885957 RepID=A0A5K7ZLL8_9BACT|nr:hypothetical protein [Desulfosarcina ovata]BBO81195.1 hypothetical protein DSCO28_17610 [Desulfosarcina ovata subsp. sediminis]
MRNYQCPHYHRCLTRAAHANRPDLYCRGCLFEHNHSGRVDLDDLAGALALIAVIVSPGIDPRMAVGVARNNLLPIVDHLAGDRLFG